MNILKKEDVRIPMSIMSVKGEVEAILRDSPTGLELEYSTAMAEIRAHFFGALTYYPA